jgi:hypothetical protein
MGWFVRDSGLYQLFRAASDSRISLASSHSHGDACTYDDPTPRYDRHSRKRPGSG